MNASRLLALLCFAPACGGTVDPGQDLKEAAAPRFVDILSGRLGLRLEPPLTWQRAEWTEIDEKATVAVALSDGVMLTEDGERMPIDPEHVRLGSAVTQQDPDGPSAAEWRCEMLGYIRLSRHARRWLRQHLATGLEEHPSHEVLVEVAIAEARRIKRDLGAQWLPWPRASSRAAQLVVWVKHMGLGGDVLADCESLSRSLRDAAAFEAESQHLKRQVDMLAHSEVNSVCDRGGKAIVGYYCVDYSWLHRVELIALADYWDSVVWTRGAQRIGEDWVMRTVGENVQEAAARMTGIPQVSKEKFLEWARH